MKKMGVLLLLVGLLTSPCSAAPVRDLPHTGVIGLSWVVNVTAKQYIGLSIFRVIPRKVGWFFEGKTGRQHSYSTGYYDNISVAQAEAWGDRFLKEGTVYNTYSGGITYAMSRSVFLYSGVGYSSADNYRQYYDAFQILGDNGEYWVDGRDGGAKPNVVVGAIVRASSSVVFHLGYDVEPSGLNVGIGMVDTWPLFRRN